jgi:hypothetical protein
MADIKTFTISGPAATAMAGGSLPAKRQRRSTKKNQEGGAADEPIRGVSPIMNVVKGVETSQLAATAAPPQSSTWLKYPTGAPVPPTPTPQQGGTTKHIKVELKKKAITKKVHLNPKKPEGHQKPTKKHQTKKHRKVTLGVSSLHKRITRAKKLSKEVKAMPIDKLKDKLVKGGLIKPNSKAPESLLRTIAADAAVVNKKAL